MSQITPTTLIHDSSKSDVFIDWITQTASMSNPPKVHSISYGIPESALGSGSIMNAFNSQAIKLGVMGVTIVVASGDDGAPGYNARTSASNCGYDASFPASSPYVVAVGATMGPEAGTTEVVCSAYNGAAAITSGGGFSKLASQPAYQYRAVKAYFTKALSNQPVGGFTSGRGFPDVSLAGKSYLVVIGGVLYQLSGTSASAPVFAAMVSLVNAARIKANRTTLGFVNPALYYYNGSFANDITAGDNKCTASRYVCCSQGFSAANGWDPATGFGSVDFLKFYNVFLNSNLNFPTAAPTTAPQNSFLDRIISFIPLSNNYTIGILVAFCFMVCCTCFSIVRCCVRYCKEDNNRFQADPGTLASRPNPQSLRFMSHTERSEFERQQRLAQDQQLQTQFREQQRIEQELRQQQILEEQFRRQHEIELEFQRQQSEREQIHRIQREMVQRQHSNQPPETILHAPSAPHAPPEYTDIARVPIVHATIIS